MTDKKGSKGSVFLVGLGVLGIATVFGVVALCTTRSEPADPARAEALPATGDLEQKVANLERRLQSMQLQVASAKGTEAQATRDEAAQPAAPAAPARNTVTAEQRDQMIVGATLDRMEAEMKRRPADRGWEQQSRAVLAEMFAAPELAGSTLAELTCTEALCKSVLNHSSPETREKFVNEGAMLRPPFNTHHFFHYEPETGQTTVYFARRGERLPAADLSGIPTWN